MSIEVEMQWSHQETEYEYAVYLEGLIDLLRHVPLNWKENYPIVLETLQKEKWCQLLVRSPLWRNLTEFKCPELMVT